MPPPHQPLPPLETTVMPAGAQLMFTFVTGIPMLAVLAVAVAHLVRRRDALLLLCFLGGLAAVMAEPVVDVLSHLYFPVIGQQTAFTALGRPIPWALVFAYPWYVGGQGYLAYRLFASRPSAGRIWRLWGLYALSNIAVETPGVLTGFHVYYDNQPLNLWGFPLWCAAVQAIMPMAAGALIHAARPRLGNGWRLLAVVPLVPMADGMVNAGLDLPMWIALGSGVSWAGTYLAAALTIGMAGLGVWVLTVLLARPPGITSRVPTHAG